MSPPRLLVCAIALGFVVAAQSALAEMYKYTDSKGRVHFTQDIGQVPPEYRSQVERKVLKRKISVTGEGRAQAQQRAAMEKRSRQLGDRRDKALRAVAVPPRARQPENPLTGAPPPKKYHTDCSVYTTNGHCRKYLTREWRAWDAANGGNNGKPVIRRRIGK